jgi:Flp pilus assembly protein TadG
MNAALRPPRLLSRRHQKGAAGIEFALLFSLFFFVLYGVVSYGIVMAIQQALTHAAAEGARAGVSKVNQTVFSNTNQQQTQQSLLATNAATRAFSWLPEVAKGVITVTPTWTTETTPITTGDGTLNINTPRLTVTVTYPNYASNPIAPVLDLPGLGQVPRVPVNLVGIATASP